MKRKIYLAGPEVFLENAVNIGQQKKTLCELYGFTGLFPLDNTFGTDPRSPQELGLIISKANEDLIEESDAIIANMTPFRSTSCDVGTAYEMGFAKALKKPVFAYTNDTRLFLQRNIEDLPGVEKVSDEVFLDEQKMSLENFGLVDNLMLDGAVASPIVLHDLIDNEQVYTELLGFEQALKQLVIYFENIK